MHFSIVDYFFPCAHAIEFLNSCQLGLGSADSVNFRNVSVHLDLGHLAVLCVFTPSDLIYSFIHQIFIVQDMTAVLRVYVFWFPRAAITKHHKLGGLKQQKFILSQFWRPEV